MQRDLVMPPLVDDGLLEIVGFKDAWHGLVLLSPKGHGTRLGQVNISITWIAIYYYSVLRCKVLHVSSLTNNYTNKMGLM
jgi:hypothetical protein